MLKRFTLLKLTTCSFKAGQESWRCMIVLKSASVLNETQRTSREYKCKKVSCGNKNLFSIRRRAHSAWTAVESWDDGIAWTSVWKSFASRYSETNAHGVRETANRTSGNWGAYGEVFERKERRFLRKDPCCKSEIISTQSCTVSVMRGMCM